MPCITFLGHCITKFLSRSLVFDHMALQHKSFYVSRYAISVSLCVVVLEVGPMLAFISNPGLFCRMYRYVQSIMS